MRKTITLVRQNDIGCNASIVFTQFGRDIRRLTRRRSWHGPAPARRPSRLVQRNLRGVTPPASRASHAGMRRAALPWPSGPWPRSLTSDPLGGHRLRRLTFPRPNPTYGAVFVSPRVRSGLTFSVESADLRPIGTVLEVVVKRASRATISPVKRFTRQQGRYLSLIYVYTRIHGEAPAEADIRRFFRVTAPVVHQMVLTLHKNQLIARMPGKPRSVEVLVPPKDLPLLDLLLRLANVPD